MQLKVKLLRGANCSASRSRRRASVRLIRSTSATTTATGAPNSA
jgi:hypothetical protein